MDKFDLSAQPLQAESCGKQLTSPSLEYRLEFTPPSNSDFPSTFVVWKKRVHDNGFGWEHHWEAPGMRGKGATQIDFDKRTGLLSAINAENARVWEMREPKPHDLNQMIEWVGGVIQLGDDGRVTLKRTYKFYDYEAKKLKLRTESETLN